MPPLDPNNPQIPTTVRPTSRAPAEPVTTTPYDFIMRPSTSPAKKGLGLPGGPKLVYIAGGGVLLVLLLFVVLTLSRGSSSTPALLSLVQQQAEIARVAELHYADIKDPSTKSFIVNTQLSISSAQSDYLSYLSSKGAAIDPKQIALGINVQTDTALDAAVSTGALDSTLKSTMQLELERYQQTIQTAYKSSTNAETKALLKSFFDQAALLIAQSKS